MVVGLLAALLLYLGVTLMQVWLASREDQARPVQAIVVLGAAQYNGKVSPVLKARLDHAHDLWVRHLSEVIVVTGGRQPGDRFTEATASANYLASKGVPDSAVLREVSGRNSWQSLAASAAFLKARKISTVLLVSDPFHDKRIALMAGDVNKLQPANVAVNGVMAGAYGGPVAGGPPVVEKTFDDYHLYTLQNPTTLPDRETKQVEFLRASQVSTKRIYVYDGMQIDNRFQNWNYDNIRNNPEYGTLSNPKVWVMREFVNNEANHLGMPLPQGNVRFYRRDANGQLEFTGENQIRHTPKDETIQVYTGTAFDVVGERRRTDYQINHGNRTADEAFEIKLRNHKREPVAIRVVEHLYRGYNWNITIETDPHGKKDSQTVEYQITVKPDEEKILKYSVHYTW